MYSIENVRLLQCSYLSLSGSHGCTKDSLFSAKYQQHGSSRSIGHCTSSTSCPRLWSEFLYQNLLHCLTCLLNGKGLTPRTSSNMLNMLNDVTHSCQFTTFIHYELHEQQKHGTLWESCWNQNMFKNTSRQLLPHTAWCKHHEHMTVHSILNLYLPCARNHNHSGIFMPALYKHATTEYLSLILNQDTWKKLDMWEKGARNGTSFNTVQGWSCSPINSESARLPLTRHWKSSCKQFLPLMFLKYCIFSNVTQYGGVLI